MAIDLDQGGLVQEWDRVWMGPSVGWVYRPARNVLPIIAPGTYTVDLAISLITINVAGAVTVILPSLSNPPSAVGNPGFFVRNPITIVDIGGNGVLFPIAIQPTAPATIAGLASIAINSNFGGYTLIPKTGSQLWSFQG